MQAGAGVTDHTELTSIGTNTHAQIDSHIASTSNPHSTTLQQAYNAATAVPQINVNATPDPVTIDATVAGNVFQVRGITDLTLIRSSTTGSDIVGGHNAGNILTLEGALAGSADTGRVESNSPMEINYNTVDNTTPAEPFAMRWAPAVPVTGAYVGGFLTCAPVFTVTTGVYIPATFSDTGVSNIGAAPGFSAITFINMLHTVQNSGNFNMPSGIMFNVGFVHSRTTSGTSTTAGVTGFSLASQTRATVSGAVMTRTAQTGIAVRPSFSTVAGSTVNLGTIVALDCLAPAVALFQPQAGVENMTAYYGMRMPNITFGGASRIVNCINSALAAATNVRCINHTGTAASTHNGQLRFEADLTGVTFGASQDFQLGWAGANFFFMQQNTAPAGQIRISSVTVGSTAQRWLFTASTRPEFNFDCDRFSLGGQTGAVGNQVGAFVAPTRTVAIAGEWSDFLLTQAGNITVNAAMGLVAGWTINAPSITLGTGSVTTAAGLNIGGNPGSATNRVGLRILSNPTGGAGVNAALWITAGRAQFDGFVDINQPIALGGGAAATLGTIGGSGPTAAAQAQWVEIEVAGVRHWIPAWT